MAAISVIVPVYKVEPYLSRCVDSILNQTYTDYELILVDDGSPDRCGEICDGYAAAHDHIHVIHRKNGGLSAARNSGIEWMLAHSDSQYVAFIDSDDWIHPQYLEILMKAIETPGAAVGMVGRNYVSAFDDAYPHYDPLPDAVLYDGEALFLARDFDFNYAWGKLYRREHFQTLRYPDGQNFEDVFTTYQVLFTCGKTALIDEPLYYYFNNSEGISHSPWKSSELVVFEGMRNQMAFYKAHSFRQAFAKEERLYISHHAYQLIRIRSNRADWKKNRPLWYQIRREMLAEMKARGSKYTFRTMPYCFQAAYPRIAILRNLAGRVTSVLKRYSLRELVSKIIEKLGGHSHGNS